MPAGPWVHTQNFNSIMQHNGARLAAVEAALRRGWPVLERHLPRWTSVLLVLIIAWLLAILTWELVPAPHPATPIYNSAPSAVARPSAASQVAGMHLFGVAGVSNTGTAPETTLALTLRGIVAATRGNTDSRAIIAAGGNEQTYAVGAQLPGGAVIRAIYPDHVMLEVNGSLQSLSLPKSAGGGSDTAALAAPAATPIYGSTLPPMANLGELRQQLVNHPERLLDVVRAMPVMENGKLAGYRVFPVANSRVFSQLGLQPGDVVTAVNGMSLDNPAQSMQVLNNLRTSDQISITFLRNGQQQTQILQMSSPGGGSNSRFQH